MQQVQEERDDKKVDKTPLTNENDYLQTSFLP
jgi:hypothetical protein